MKKPHLGFLGLSPILLLLFLLCAGPVLSQSDGDGAAMEALRKRVGPKGWTGSDFCKWPNVACTKDRRVTKIQIGNQKLTGSLPPEIKDLSSLKQLEVMTNGLTGPFPSLSGSGSLRVLLAHDNKFSSFPPDFFTGLSALEHINIDDNPFSAWNIPASIKDATGLKYFSANRANITGKISDVFTSSTFPGLTDLHLAMNYLEGELLAGFSGSMVQSLWLNGQQGSPKLNGTIDVLQNMTSLHDVWLHGNEFTGSIPDFSKLSSLQALSLRDNKFMGVVPPSLVNLKTLTSLNLTNNRFQGPMPKFGDGIQVDMGKIGGYGLQVDRKSATLSPSGTIWRASWWISRRLRRMRREK